MSNNPIVAYRKFFDGLNFSNKVEPIDIVAGSMISHPKNTTLPTIYLKYFRQF